jgi:4-amino-4-deoxy-L-arabinose transferase-like glycosyltransferase
VYAADPRVGRLRVIFAGLALFFLFVPLVASLPLIDPDEGLHAAIAQEMLQRHDYVTPTFLGEPFLDKPILFFWAEAASLRLFGMTEAAVRLPPLIFGLLGMLAVAWLARYLFGDLTGLLAGIVYASMLLPLGVSQVAVHDIGLIPFMCVAIWCVLRCSESARPWARGVPLGICLGLSILTKGLVAVVFVGFFALCFAAVRRDRWLRVAAVITVGGVVALAVAAPWYVAMERAHAGYLYYYFVERHLRGYLTATQRHGGRPWWYYLPILIGGALPWTGYLVGAFRRRRSPPRSERLPRAMTIVWSWIAVSLVFLSIGESKLVTYVLPLFPGFAIAIGKYLASAWTNHAEHGRERSATFTIGMASQIVALAILPAAAMLLLRSRYGSPSAIGWTAAIVTIPVVLLAGLSASRARRLETFVSRIALGIGVCVTVVLFFVAPGVVASMTAKDLANWLNASGSLPSSVIVVEERIGSIAFYLAPALRAHATPDRILTSSRIDALELTRITPDDGVVAVRDDELAKFQQLFPVPPQPVAHAGRFSIFRVAQLRAALDQPK